MFHVHLNVRLCAPKWRKDCSRYGLTGQDATYEHDIEFRTTYEKNDLKILFPQNSCWAGVLSLFRGSFHQSSLTSRKTIVGVNRSCKIIHDWINLQYRHTHKNRSQIRNPPSSCAMCFFSTKFNACSLDHISHAYQLWHSVFLSQ